MNDAIIKVRGLGKKYILSHQQDAGYTTLRDVIGQKVKGMVAGNHTGNLPSKEDFWALKDVSFEIRRGDAIGIIGHNGAGKSTLLKLLSRITEPSKGSIEINGRIASLLEVGTGFHPELTGRENIFLNGAILGMGRAEIRKKFDEIVEFSGVAKFLDTPVKRYSSGMYVRLAFAVAAHLEPEILVVDEVLAMGDAEFQRKSLGKMEEVSKSGGRTILLVSHNMESILKFCTKTFLLENGELKMNGETKAVIDNYLKHYLNTKEKKTWEDKDAPSDNFVKLLSASLHDEKQQVRSEYAVTEKIGITLEYQVLEEGVIFSHGINIYNGKGLNIFNSDDVMTDLRLQKRKKGMYRATVWLPANLLPEETFTVGVALFSPNPFYVHVHKKDVLAFKIYDPMEGQSARGDYTGDFGGVIRPLLTWEASTII